MNVGYARVSTSSQNLENQIDLQFGRRAILSFKDKKVIFKEYEKGKSVAWLSKFFHVAQKK